MIKVKISKASGELYYSTPGRNGRKIGSNETFKTKAGIRTNVRANLKFWGGKRMKVQWPDGSIEVIN